MAKRVKMRISKARTSLFHLTDLVRRAGGETVVLLEQRGGREPVAMVRESRLAYLEERVRQLEERQQDGPFTLAGSLTTALDDAALEQVLHEIRRGWSTRPEGSGPSPVPTRRRR